MRDRALLTRLQASKKCILLLGPRQVGKSTLCRALDPLRTINLADEAEYLSYAKDPARFKRELAASQKHGLIVVDEVQRIPALLNTVQSIIDNPKNKNRFILTGSSARKLRQEGANLLPGRVILEHLDPLMLSEIGESFDLKRALQLGMLPGIYLGDHEAADVLGTYAEVYLREEIRAEALARDVGSYARFLDVAALMSGQWLNYSKLSSDAEIPKETIRRYVGLLEDTLLMFRVPAFQAKAKTSRRVSQRDKLYLFDVGVRNALLGAHHRPVSIDQIGLLFEHWFVLQIIYLNRALRKNWRISSYRSDGGAEVDLVIERADDLIGLEIKASKNIGKSDLRGLKSLAEISGKRKPLRKLTAYFGETSQLFEDGARAVPYRELLAELASATD